MSRRSQPIFWDSRDLDQGDLFDFVLRARNDDPETSHEAMAAYDKAKMSAAAKCVTELYRTHGELADFQLKPLFDVTWGHDCSFHLYRQARSVARDLGTIVDTGKRITNPETNRLQIVWGFTSCGAPLTIRKCHFCGHVLRKFGYEAMPSR